MSPRLKRRHLINTDKQEDLERIKQLLPRDVKEKVAINPMFFKAKQLQRELLVDFSATIYPAVPLSSSVFLTNEMVKEIFSYNELDTAPVLSLKEAFEKEPVPDSTDSFAAYKATLVAIEHQHILATPCETLIPSLQQYNKLFKKQYHLNTGTFSRKVKSPLARTTQLFQAFIIWSIQ